MAGEKEFDYSTIDNPYDNQMNRSDTVEIAPSTGFGTGEGTPAEEGTVVKAGQELNDVWLGTWMKSRNYQPKTQGFLIDGRTGYIECMRIYVGKGGIEGGSIHIPDQESANSWHVDNAGNMWVGCNVDDWELDPTRDNPNANSVIQNDGKAKFYDIRVDSGVFLGAIFLTDTDGIHAPGPAAVRVEIGGDTPGSSNDINLYEDTYVSGGAIQGDYATLRWRRLAYPDQAFVMQKRVGLNSPTPAASDNVFEMLWPNPRQSGHKNRIIIGRRGDSATESVLYNDAIWTYAKEHLMLETSQRLSDNYGEIDVYTTTSGLGTFDSDASRVRFAPYGTTNGYDPTTGGGGGATLFVVGYSLHGWNDKDGFWVYGSYKFRPWTTDSYDIGSELNRFNKVYSKQFHFTDTKYFWLDLVGTPTVNLQGANFYCNGGIGSTFFDASSHILVAGNYFTAQSITYLDGSMTPQTRTFLVV